MHANSAAEPLDESQLTQQQVQGLKHFKTLLPLFHRLHEVGRARDKADKSLEVYKFFVNALYVALTRALRNVYLIESDTQNPLLSLLDLSVAGNIAINAQQSSLEDWQKEARKRVSAT